MNNGERINKYLSTNGYCSRREADRLITQGKVFINDQAAGLGDQVFPGDDVRVLGRDKKVRKQKLYLLLHKPTGYSVTSRKRNVLELIDTDERVYPVGRLSSQTTGLLLFTNDGVLGNRLTNPRYSIEQEYVVDLDRSLEKIDLGRLQQSHKVRLLSHARFAIILEDADQSNVVAMCEALGYHVVNLMRTRIGSVKMPTTYPEGNWRYLTEKEVRDLKKDIGLA